MRRAALIRLCVLLAVVLAPAIPAVGQEFFTCSDHYDESPCNTDDRCTWCPAYGMCLKAGDYPSCFCENRTAESDCGTAPLCQWCQDSVYGLPASVCRYREGDSCWCGNAVWDALQGEECDLTAHCTSGCKCERNYVSIDGVCGPECGDGVLVDTEQCEYVNGIQTPHCINCRCEAGYVPHPTDLAQGCGQPPAITSAGVVTFTVGQAGSFTSTATGSPTPTLSITGSLPANVFFTDVGDGSASLSGAPAAGTGGSYPLTLTASSTFGTATQAFTLTVDEAPAFTSADAATFTAGQLGSFTITAIGSPTPTLTSTGTLPTGIGLVDNGDGTATLSGTPAAGGEGTYPLTLTASNGIGAPATQPFTLTVGTPPAITSTDATTFTVGQAGSFTVMTSGFPPPALDSSGALPAGVSLTDNGDGTASLAGTPELGTGDAYALTLSADNGIGTPATQSFTLTVASVTSFAGPTATGTGEATASFAGGGAGCTFASAAFLPVTAVPAGAPAVFPHGLFEFTLSGCDGPVALTIVYPSPLPAWSAYWKFGPEPDRVVPHWYRFLEPIAEPSAVFTLVLTDGARGDDDLTVNGTIVDQGGPGEPPDPIPALNLAGFALLGLLVALGGFALLKRLG